MLRKLSVLETVQEQAYWINYILYPHIVWFYYFPDNPIVPVNGPTITLKANGMVGRFKEMCQLQASTNTLPYLFVIAYVNQEIVNYM